MLKGKLLVIITFCASLATSCAPTVKISKLLSQKSALKVPLSINITVPSDDSFINIANDSTLFTVGGTCKDSGQTVTIEIDGTANGSAVCNGSTFVSSNVDTTSLSAAVHSITATITDTSAKTTVSNSISVTKDVTSPTVSLSAASVSTINASSSTAYILTFSDTNLGTLTNATINAAITINGANTGCTAATTGTGATTRTVTISNCSGNGSVSISVGAGAHSDLASNALTAAGPSGTFTVDNSAPTIAITSPANSSYVNAASNSAAFTVSGTCSESSQTVTIKIDGSSNGSATCNGTTFSSSNVNTTTLSAGSHSFTATISDASSNTTVSSAISVTKDVTSPTVSLSAASVSPVSSSTTTAYTLTFSDTNLGTLTNATINAAITINGANTGCTAATTGAGATTRTVTISNCSGNGSVSISVGAGAHSDLASNALTAAGPSGTFTVDNSSPAPTILSVTAPANATYKIGDNLDFTVTFSANVTITGTPRIPLTVGSSTVYANKNSGSNDTYIYRYTIQSGDLDTNGIAMTSPMQLNSGTIQDSTPSNATLTFSAPNTASINVDGVAPTLTGLSDDSSPHKTKTWNWGCSETCTYRYVIDTTSNTAPSGGYGATTTASQNTGDNIYYIHVQALDSNGNASAVSHISAVIDNTAPSAPASISDPVRVYSLTSGWATTSAATDTNGINHYEYAIGTTSGGTQTRSWTTTGSIGTYFNATGLTLTNSTTYYFSVRAHDSAGNISSVVTSDGWIADGGVPPETPTVDSFADTCSLSPGISTAFGSAAAPAMNTGLDVNKVVLISNRYTNEYYCAGVLLSPTYVLTSAHCVAGKNSANLTVTAGITDINDLINAQKVNVSSYVTHTSYLPVDTTSDLAIITTAASITISDPNLWPMSPQTATLPVSGSSTSSASSVTAYSWHASSALGCRQWSNTLRTVAGTTISDIELAVRQVGFFFIPGGNEFGVYDGSGTTFFGFESVIFDTSGNVVGLGASAPLGAGGPDTITRISDFLAWISANTP